MRIVLFILSLLASVAIGAENLNLRLNAHGDIYELVEFDRIPGDSHYFGAYTFTYALTGGTALHLFPNGRFAIVEFLDIGPDFVSATGTYKVSGTALALVFLRVKPRHESVRAEFADLHIVWGYMDKGDYITGFEVFVFPKDDWRKLYEEKKDLSYMQRRTAYHDWQRILHEYQAQ